MWDGYGACRGGNRPGTGGGVRANAKIAKAAEIAEEIEYKEIDFAFIFSAASALLAVSAFEPA
jgi:hypothetical protein